MTRTLGLPAKVFAVIFLTFPILTQALKWVEYKFDRCHLNKGMGSWTEDEIKASVDQFFTDWDAGNTEGLLKQMEPKVYISGQDCVPSPEILGFMQELRGQGFTTETTINELRPFAAMDDRIGVGIHGKVHFYNSEGNQVSNDPAVVSMVFQKYEDGIKVASLWKVGGKQ